MAKVNDAPENWFLASSGTWNDKDEVEDFKNWQEEWYALFAILNLHL